MTWSSWVASESLFLFFFLEPEYFCWISWFGFMLFYATFNNISVISWRSVLLVETEVPRENHWPVLSHRQTLSHNVFVLWPLYCLSFLDWWLLITTLASSTFLTKSTIIFVCLQQYFSYIVAISFIGGNRSTPRKPLTCLKSQTNFIT
jgi:hypothetical protein